MIPLLVVVGIILLFCATSAIAEHVRVRREQRLINDLEPKFAELFSRLSNIPGAKLQEELRHVKGQFSQSLATLTDDQGQVLNRCAKCADTLVVRNTAYHGKILGCPNYPKCRHLVKAASLNPSAPDEISGVSRRFSWRLRRSRRQ